MLFRDEETQFLSVVCGSVGLYTIDVELLADEVEHFALSPTSAARALAASVTFDPEAYADRRMEGFDRRLDVQSAVAKWRRSPAGRA